MKYEVLVIVVLLVLVLVIHGNRAQEADTQSPILVTIDSREMDTITQPLLVRALVSNQGKGVVNVYGAYIELPAVLAGSAGPLDSSGTGGGTEDGIAGESATSSDANNTDGMAARRLPCKTLPFDLNPDDSQRLSCDGRKRPVRKNLDLLLYKKRSLQLTLVVEFKDASGRVQPSVRKRFSVEPESTIQGTVLGGMIGVLVLPLFRWLVKKHAGEKADARPAQFIWTWLLGWLTVGLFLSISHFAATELPAMPVAVDVKDFYGGLLCGLLFEPIAGQIAKLTSDKKEKQQALPRTP